MADIITTLHKRNDPTANIYPNVKDTNIPDTILRVADLGKYVNLLSSIKINGDADYVSVTADVGTFATADITTLNISGISQFEGKSTFGSDVEVDGGLTLNSPSSLHFKTGDKDYTDFQNFLARYNSEAYQFLFANMTLRDTEEGIGFVFNPVSSFPNITKATSLHGIFANIKVNGINEISMPVMESKCELSEAFAYADISQVTFLGGTFSILAYSFIDSTVKTVATTGVTKFIGVAPGCFQGCANLHTVGTIDVSGLTYVGNLFLGCISLKHIGMTHFKLAFDISASTQFEQSDLVEIIGNLDTVTTAQTLTMGATNLAKLTSDQILVATGKGWTLA